MTMSGLAANRKPRIVAPKSPRIIFSGFHQGGWGARSDSKAADWNYDHWMFDLAVRDPGCHMIEHCCPFLHSPVPLPSLNPLDF